MLTYEEKTGKTKITSNWWIKSLPDGYEIIAKNTDEHHYILCDLDYSTMNWEFTSKKSGTELTAKREGDRLFLSGSNNGKEIKEEHELGQIPWFQFIEVSLTGFIQSTAEEIQFWIIQPYNLKLYKMVAIKEEIETVKVNNRDVEAIRIKVTLPGIASIFWSARYWYRKSDGVYIRYEGVRGGPGTPKTIVELIN